MNIIPQTNEIASAGLSKAEFIRTYENLRKYVEHEDNLVNARISRTLLLHGFLFAAFVLLVQAKAGAMSSLLSEGNCKADSIKVCAGPELGALFQVADLMLMLIAVIGVITSWGVLVGVRAAMKAIRGIEDVYDFILEKRDTKARELPLPYVTGGGDKRAREKGFSSNMTLPISLVGLWLLVAIVCMLQTFPDNLRQLSIYLQDLYSFGSALIRQTL